MLTYRQVEESSELWVFGTDGALQQRRFVPLPQPNVFTLHPWNVCGGQLYQILPGKQEGQWELRVP